MQKYKKQSRRHAFPHRYIVYQRNGQQKQFTGPLFIMWPRVTRMNGFMSSSWRQRRNKYGNNYVTILCIDIEIRNGDNKRHECSRMTIFREDSGTSCSKPYLLEAVPQTTKETLQNPMTVAQQSPPALPCQAQLKVTVMETMVQHPPTSTSGQLIHQAEW